jgi:hypothetical protein
MTVTQVPFFLSSASGRRPNAGGTKFTVECSPALSVPSKATSCTLHVHSASVPYTWNNVDSTNNSFVDVPKLRRPSHIPHGVVEACAETGCRI